MDTQTMNGNDKIASALSAAQGDMPSAEMDRTNPHFGNRYATLASIWQAIRPVLAKHGLSVVQQPSHHEQGIALTTTLMHTSGQQISSTMVMPLAKRDPQSYGSALTYARRYALCAVLGVVADDDDDANAATSQGERRQQQGDRRQQQPRSQQAAQNTPRGTDKPSHQFYRQLAASAAALGIPGTAATEWIKHSLIDQGIKSTDDLTESQMKAIIGTLSPKCPAEKSKIGDLTGFAIFSAAKKRGLTDDEANGVVEVAAEAVDAAGSSLSTMATDERKRLLADVAAGQFDPQPANN